MRSSTGQTYYSTPYFVYGYYYNGVRYDYSNSENCHPDDADCIKAGSKQGWIETILWLVCCCCCLGCGGGFKACKQGCNKACCCNWSAKPDRGEAVDERDWAKEAEVNKNTVEMNVAPTFTPVNSNAFEIQRKQTFTGKRRASIGMSDSSLELNDIYVKEQTVVAQKQERYDAKMFEQQEKHDNTELDAEEGHNTATVTGYANQTYGMNAPHNHANM
jgi:hypothetical protein